MEQGLNLESSLSPTWKGTTISLNEKPSKKHERETDYRAFFILGISILSMEIIFTSAISSAFISFLGLGAVSMIIGLAKRDKWAKSKKES